MKIRFGQAKHGRELSANAMHTHAGENQIKAPIIKTRQRGAGFNRHGMNAVIEQIKADNMIRLRKGCIGGSAITFQEAKRLISRCLWPDLRRLSAKCAGAVNYGGQGVVADLNRLRRITRSGGAGCDDQGNGLTQMAHAIRRQNRAWRNHHGGHTRHHRRARERRQIILRQISGGENTHHAGHGARCIGVDVTQDRVGIGRAKYHGMQRIRRQHIRNIAPTPGQKPRIFQPGDGFSAEHQAPLLRRFATNSSLSWPQNISSPIT